MSDYNQRLTRRDNSRTMEYCDINDCFDDSQNDDSSYSGYNYSKGRTSNTRSRRSAQPISLRTIFALIAAAVLLGISTWAFLQIFTPVGTISNFKVCRRSADEIDLCDSGLTSLNGLWRCNKLKKVNARGLELDIESVELFNERMPNCTVICNVPIGGQIFDGAVSSNIALPASTSEVELQRLRLLPLLTNVDATACPLSYSDTFAKLNAAMPNCAITYRIGIGDETYLNTDKEITVCNIKSGELGKKLPLFDNIEYVDASGCELYDELMSISKSMPDCAIKWELKAYDIVFSSLDEDINLQRKKIDSIDELESILPYLPKAKRIDMCGCGFSNEEMEKLCERLPDYKLIWEVTVGGDEQKWTLRTDALAFSTLNYTGGPHYTQKEFMPIFKYCTDLIALDLGHSSINDISAITNLQNLRILILADNEITDISPLAELPQLEYLEIFTNPIRDAFPICDMKSLVDVDIGNSYIKDYSFMYNLPPTVRKVWADMTFMGIPSNERNAIQQKYPDCLFSYDEDDPCASIWCDQRWADAKTFINNWKNVVAFNDWGDYEFKDGVKLETYKPRKKAIDYAANYTGKW